MRKIRCIWKAWKCLNDLYVSCQVRLNIFIKLTRAPQLSLKSQDHRKSIRYTCISSPFICQLYILFFVQFHFYKIAWKDAKSLFLIFISFANFLFIFVQGVWSTPDPNNNINCVNCANCKNGRNCVYCKNCSDCTDCRIVQNAQILRIIHV